MSMLLEKFLEIKSMGGSTEVALKAVLKMDQRLIETVIPGGNPLKVPKAACLDKYLPKGRPATSEEIRKAWQQCLGEE